MTLVTEIGGWRRFKRPGQLMAYLGLVPQDLPPPRDVSRRGPHSLTGLRKDESPRRDRVWPLTSGPPLTIVERGPEQWAPRFFIA